MPIAAYTLRQAQALVKDAQARQREMHNRWRMLEHVFRTGQLRGEVTAGDVPGQLWEELPGLTLDGINKVLPHLTMIIETVAARDPELVVEPQAGGPEAENGAKAAEAALRYYWKRARVTDSVLADMTQDMVTLGNGFAKVGWAHEEADVDRDRSEVEEELAALIEADRRESVLQRRDLTDPETLIDRIQLVEQVVLRDEPWVEYVSPYDMLLPWNARRLEDAPWIGQRVVLPLDEVLTNDVFDDAAKEQIHTMYADTDDKGFRRSEEQPGMRGWAEDGDDDPFAHAELFEFYDMRTRRMMVHQLDSDTPLFDDELPYGHRHPPFVHLRGFNHGGSRIWAFGDLENIASIQRQLNEFTYAQLENARRSGSKTAVDRNVLTPQAREALESDEPGTVVEVDAPGGAPLSEFIAEVPTTAVSADVYEAIGSLDEAMRDVLGLNDFQSGGVGADRMSATAAAVVDGTATLRAQGKARAVERAASQIGLQIALLAQEFMDSERLIRISGPEAASWLELSNDDLVGEYDVKVEAGSTQAQNPSTREQRAMDRLGTVVPAIAELGFDPEPLLRQVIRDLGLDPDVVLRRAEPPPEAAGAGAPLEAAAEPPTEGTVPQEAMGGPPVPAAVEGGPAL